MGDNQQPPDKNPQAESTIIQQKLDVIMMEYNTLRNEDFKTKDRIQTIIIQSFIFIGIVSWFGWTNYNAAPNVLSLLVFTVFIPFISCTTLIILMSCHLRATEICIYISEVENKVDLLLNSNGAVKPLNWINVHYMQNKGKGFEALLLRADAGGAVLLFVLISALSELIGYTLSNGFKPLFFISLSGSLLAMAATAICAFKALALHNNFISNRKKSPLNP